MKQIDSMELKARKHWWDCHQPGEYAWEELPNGFAQRLFLSCPWCSSATAMPMLTIETTFPLTVKEQLNCGFCAAAFSITEGRAVRSN